MGGVVLAQLQPNQVLGFVLLDIAVILVAARTMGSLARKIGQPTVVGEILAGILLGPTLLGRTLFAWDVPWDFLHCTQALAATGGEPSITACFFPPQARSVLGILGQLALVFFMFLVGLELDFDLLKGKGKSIAILAFGVVAVPIGLAFAVGPLLYSDAFVPGFGTPGAAGQTSFILFLAAMLSVTAFPVMARILQEKGLTASPMGSIGVAAAAVVTVLMFLTVAVAAGVATEQGPTSLALKFVIAAIYIGFMFLVLRPALSPLGRMYEQAGRLTPGLFAGILIVLFASSYAAHQIGINVIVGGFLAGAVLPARQALFREMASRLSDLTAVILLPIFLAFSGLNTDFTALALSHLPGIALFLVAAIAGKWLGGAVFARLGGLSWSEGNVLGILMNCRGLLVLVVALIALTEGVITPAMQVGGVVVALVTTMMTGPLFDRFAPTVAVPAAAEDLEAVPAGGVRVLAVLDDLDDAPAVAHAAFQVAGERRPAEVVLTRLFALPEHDELPTGISDAALEADRSLRALKILATFAPDGVTVTPLAFSSADPAGDVLRIARERDGTAIVIGWRAGSRGAGSIADVARVAAGAPCPVVAYQLGRDEPREGAVVLVGGAATGDAAALARHLAGDAQVVEATDGPEAARSARATVVAVTAVDGTLADAETIEATAAAAGGPVYLVAEAARREPAGVGGDPV